MSYTLFKLGGGDLAKGYAAPPRVEELLNMMRQAMSQDKTRMGDLLEGLWAEVVSAAPAGTSAHEIEEKLLQGVLK